MTHPAVLRIELNVSVGGESCPCEVAWRPHDPAFVKLTFGIAPYLVEWEVPREGLYTGMELQPGGDIGVVIDFQYGLTTVTLRSPDGVADVKFALVTLGPWLEETDRIVPIGGETRDLDWASLLRGDEPLPLEAPPDLCIVCDPDSSSGAFLRDFSQNGVCPSCGRDVR